MKSFSEYIKEAYSFRLGGSQKKGFKEYYGEHHYFPKTGRELIDLMNKLRKERGEDGNFNDIDTSEVTDMSWIFYNDTNFNGDISGWDTSSVTDMNHMFYYAKNFDRDISDWETGSITNMHCMFCYAESFNQDISSWNVSRVTDSSNIFYHCPIEKKYMPKFR